MKRIWPILILLFLTTSANATDIVGTGSFHAGGSTVLAQQGEGDITGFSSFEDGSLDVNLYGSGPTSPASTTGPFEMVSGNGSSYGVSFDGCSLAVYEDLIIPVSLSGTIFIDVYVPTQSLGAFTYAGFFGVGSSQGNCITRTSNFYASFFSTGIIMDAGATKELYMDFGDVRAWHGLLTGWYYRSNYRQNSGISASFSFDTWHRIGMTWYFTGLPYTEGGVYYSMNIDGGSWSENYYNMGNTYYEIDDFNYTFNQLYLGQRCKPSSGAACSARVIIDNPYYIIGYQQVDPLL